MGGPYRHPPHYFLWTGMSPCEGVQNTCRAPPGPQVFHNYTPINWAALTWKAHLDARAFFDHKGVGSRAITLARQTTLDVTSNYKFRADVLPLDHPRKPQTNAT
jgi:hypothetical protein